MITVYNQVLTEQDALAVYNVVKSQYVTQLGKETKELEQRFAKLCNRKHAITCSNGTTALHLALKILNIPKDSTIVFPSCTFAAVGFAPSYMGYNLDVVDVVEDTWNIDPLQVEKMCRSHHVGAVIAVHNYGNPANMYELLSLQKRYGFKLIEDACEALTASYFGSPAGSFGDASVFSFYGNKLVTGGEGGMLLVNDAELDKIARYYRGQAQSPTRRFWHENIGFNYRITNMQSALILSQLDRLEASSQHVQDLAHVYKMKLIEKFRFQHSPLNSRHSWWMVSLLGDDGFGAKAAAFLQQHGIETRPVFPPLSDMPAFPDQADRPISRKLNANGITLPGGPGLSLEQAEMIADLVLQIT